MESRKTDALQRGQRVRHSPEHRYVLSFRPTKINLASTRDGGDERWFGSAAELANFIEGELEGCGHVLP